MRATTHRHFHLHGARSERTKHVGNIVRRFKRIFDTGATQTASLVQQRNAQTLVSQPDVGALCPEATRNLLVFVRRIREGQSEPAARFHVHL
jgi:hypothetical protein